ncbi:MAG: hypothetical protein U1E10_15760 [Bdellovibrionales bacterium]|nr:hypothetical protein [Bdellovibrionales bacterium]
MFSKTLRQLTIIFFAVFCASELFLRLVIPASQTKQVSRPHMYEDHPELGYRLRKDLRTRVQASDGTKKLFNVTYQTDQFGRRIVPLSGTEQRQKHFVILGGSTVFGMGLPDHETLAHHLASRAPNLLPYNYAGDGYGPQNAYTQVKLGLLETEVEQAEGTTVFFFQMLNQSGGHVQTLLGSFELLLQGWGESLSFYDIDASGAREPEYLGRMLEFDPIKFYLFRFLQNSHLLNTVYPRLFPISEEQLEKTAVFIREMKKQVLRSKPKTRFVVAFHPLSDRNSILPLKKLFEDEGIETFDFSQIVAEQDLPSHIAFNRYFPHPNGKLNSLFAEKLIEDLKLKQ